MTNEDTTREHSNNFSQGLPSDEEMDLMATEVANIFGSCCLKLKQLKPEVNLIRSWFRHNRRTRAGKTLLGCSSFGEFCQVRLHRTEQAVYAMLADRKSKSATRSRANSSSGVSKKERPQPQPKRGPSRDAAESTMAFSSSEMDFRSLLMGLLAEIDKVSVSLPKTLQQKCAEIRKCLDPTGFRCETTESDMNSAGKTPQSYQDRNSQDLAEQQFPASDPASPTGRKVENAFQIREEPDGRFAVLDRETNETVALCTEKSEAVEVAGRWMPEKHIRRISPFDAANSTSADKAELAALRQTDVCHPRKVIAGTKCTCLVDRQQNQAECGHHAILECDCGSWCGCEECISVCIDVLEAATSMELNNPCVAHEHTI